MKLLSYLVTLLLLFCHPVLQSGDEWYTLYFTDPESKNITENNPERGIIKAISEAEKSFFGAFYYLSTPEIAEALVSAKSGGIDVRLVLDEHFINDPATGKDHLKRIALQRLKTAGIPVVFGGRSGIMHNKFAVIDGIYVWTGSYNLSPNGSRRNNNNAVKIRSEKLADIFTEKFNSMHRDKVFSSRREPPFSGFKRLFGGNRYHVRIDGTDINAYFAPENGVEAIIVKRILKAKESIHFMAFSFTSQNISEAMIKKHKLSGVSVNGIFERVGSNSAYSEFRKMKIEGLNVMVDSNRGAMHHKVIIIDEETVITGSYNFSGNANLNNDENILIIKNRDIAAEYLKEYERLRKS